MILTAVLLLTSLGGWRVLIYVYLGNSNAIILLVAVCVYDVAILRPVQGPSLAESLSRSQGVLFGPQGVYRRRLLQVTLSGEGEDICTLESSCRMLADLDVDLSLLSDLLLGLID